MPRPKAKATGKGKATGKPPAPLKQAPESLAPFYETLSEKHVYVAHIDSKPRDFKRKIFVVPVLLNVGVVCLLAFRCYYILPWYLELLASALGYANDTTLIAAELSWGELTAVVLRRSFTFMLDLCLSIFVWPWPFEFCFARKGNPVSWRWLVGFRDKEIYVRRSRDWDKGLGDIVKSNESRNVFLAHVRIATSPMLLQEKTGYLTMNGEWDLDWEAMILGTLLVDENKLALDAFTTLVLVYHEEFGWMCLDTQTTDGAQEDERRRQVFAFRDALAHVGKEDLFFRWIEIIQFESSQPGGFSPEKQTEVAEKIRELFRASGIDFDEFWKDSVGSDSLAGM